MLLLAKVKRISKVVYGIDLDVERVAYDSMHAFATLSALAVSGNDDLSELSVALMRKLGLINNQLEINVGG